MADHEQLGPNLNLILQETAVRAYRKLEHVVRNCKPGQIGIRHGRRKPRQPITSGWGPELFIDFAVGQCLL